MKKDVIYIDVEDDLTAIIEKIKASKASIVALVPPRRLGVLQSVVNLKLLKRAADEAGKKAVLITSDQSLMNLTAGIGLPVARNLQSRPEIVPEVDDDEPSSDIIEGALPPSTTEPEDTPVPAAIAPAATAAKSSAPAKAAKPAKTGSSKFKVPNFESFRKRIFLIVAAVVLLVGFGVWAVKYAPKATVVIKAQTEKVENNFTATIDSELTGSNLSEEALKGELRETTANLTQTFSPTGKKDIGEKAKGGITVRNCDFSDGFTLQSGSRFTAETGQTFVSTKSVTVPKFSGSASSCSTSGGSAGKATIPVEAAEIGEEFNIAAQDYKIPGISGKVDAVGTAMGGGSKRTVATVTQADVDKAKTQALEKDSKTVKDDLLKQFGPDERGLAETFVATQGKIQVEPGIGEEATGQATLTVPMTYSVLGVKNDELSGLLSRMLEDDLTDKNAQKIYDNGYKKLQIKVEDPQAKKATIEGTTHGYIGPNIDTNNLAKQIVGKRHGEIESIVSPVPGVQQVESDFSPFWVTKAPKVEKITIKLEVANEE